MTIYIETFLIQNTLINLCLLRLIKILTKTPTTWFKMVLSCLLGACFSVVSAIFINNLVVLNILKFCCAFVMLNIAFKQTKKQFIFNFILLFMLSYMMVGVITNLNSMTYFTSFGFITTSKISLELICTLFIILTFIFELVAKHLKFKIKTSNLIYQLTLFLGNNSIKINAYLDTGNLLQFNDIPVIIVDLKSYLKLTNRNFIDFFKLKTDTITTNTVVGNDNFKLFKIDKAFLTYNLKKSLLKTCYIAVSSKPVFKNTNYQALLNPSIL